MKNIPLLSLFCFCLGTTALQASDHSDLIPPSEEENTANGTRGATDSEREEALNFLNLEELAKELREDFKEEDLTDFEKSKILACLSDLEPSERLAVLKKAQLETLYFEEEARQKRMALAILPPEEIELLRKKLEKFADSDGDVGYDEDYTAEEKKEVRYFNIAATPFIERIVDALSYLEYTDHLAPSCHALNAFHVKIYYGYEEQMVFSEEDVGYREEIWPEKEQEIWTSIQELVKSPGSYGKHKEEIQTLEKELFALQKERDFSIKSLFMFNSDLEDKDASLVPVITQSTQELVNLTGICEDSNDEEDERENLLSKIAFWKNISNLLLNGVHLGQQNGWDYMTRLFLQSGLGQSLHETTKLTDEFSKLTTGHSALENEDS